MDEESRASTRLQGYDYRGGTFFLTLCAFRRKPLFGALRSGELFPTPAGCIVREEWLATARIRPEVALDGWVLMPNHLHGIVALPDSPFQHIDFPLVGAHGRAPLRRNPRSLGAVIAGFKSAATLRINLLRDMPGTPVWQRGYHEHVIRNEEDLDRIRRYILENPLRWELDDLHVLDRLT